MGGLSVEMIQLNVNGSIECEFRTINYIFYKITLVKKAGPFCAALTFEPLYLKIYRRDEMVCSTSLKLKRNSHIEFRNMFISMSFLGWGCKFI